MFTCSQPKVIMSLKPPFDLKETKFACSWEFSTSFYVNLLLAFKIKDSKHITGGENLQNKLPKIKSKWWWEFSNLSK